MKLIKFESSVFESVITKVLRNSFLIIYVSIIFSEVDIDFDQYYGFFLIYIVTLCIHVIYTNNDLTITENKLIVESSLLGKYRRKEFEKDTIENVVFKDDWTALILGDGKLWGVRLAILFYILYPIIPAEYKWVKIKTITNEEYKFFFFGMNYDFYDNTNEVLFEDMFIELAKNEVKVTWNSTEIIYFKDIQKRADKLYFKAVKKK